MQRQKERKKLDSTGTVSLPSFLPSRLLCAELWRPLEVQVNNVLSHGVVSFQSHKVTVGVVHALSLKGVYANI